MIYQFIHITQVKKQVAHQDTLAPVVLIAEA
jgi:hypothetical protein